MVQVTAHAQDVDAALARALAPGQDVVVGQAFGAPRTLLAALPRHLERLQGSRVFFGMLLGDLPALPGVALRTFFPSGPLGTAEALAARGAVYERRSLHELSAGLRSGAIPADVVLCAGTPARAGGAVSLGVTVDYVAPAAARASTVVLEAHPDMPWTGAGSLVEPAGELIEVPADDGPIVLDRMPSDRDAALAANVAGWIDDGATLQCGMGPWVGALIPLLRERRGLRVHTGLISDWLMDLEAAGALAADRPAIGTGAAGSARFYRWLDGHPAVELRAADRTHAPATLAALERLTAVNSVLEVDLLGRANSEIGRGGRRGGVAGLSDFAGAAARAADGLSVIALPSTVGRASRIVARLPEAAVSLPAAAVDVVVTEHGSADLRGLDDCARANALLAVAAPEHRDALVADVRALHHLTHPVQGR
ncbi:MAG TPA: acetyl-CoA hydrolase/transferase C-terminal domain-containing protein [Baekduia sp.]|uniref:acetyl-CoA hydrolase/transferase C-terminal domain-containing protein n=1 Tax=Baekduia sp. TaxID=2600305 RepID=UPI002D79B532|nr:acetyl-CoA hydrolase/transferase C-terminal domain-containing protein [Baekduia sp.]HET6509967.1 acetyl-CoA hydrolase/transferase C-terminal domain-containing protein [Baekduia sp.]